MIDMIDMIYMRNLSASR